MMNQTKKHTTGKKLLALLLALIMTVSLLPMSVFAAEPGAEETPVVEGQTQPAAETGEDDAEQAQEPDADEADEGEEDAVLPGDAEDDADDADAADDGVATFAATDSNATLDYRIVHLDCGRKYFSVANIKTLIDNMYLAGYNQLELAIGNAGLRFLLDDMSISFTVNGEKITYDNDTMVANIKAGNKVQNNSNDDSCLTETDMKLIIAYANARGIEVVPLLNMPGHMNAVLNAFSDYRISGKNKNYETTQSSSTLNLASDEAKAFGLALLQKYVDFFKGRVSYFNFGADEVANDIVNPFYSFNDGYAAQCAPYMNECAEIIVAAGMTPRAFNDYMYFANSSVTLNKNIEVCYWNAQWNNSPYVLPNVIANKGHKLINTNSEWYYVLNGEGNNLTYAEAHVTSLNYNDYHVGNGTKSTVNPTAGAMICLWCDKPNAGTSETVINQGTELLEKFATKNSTLGFTKATITTEAPVIMNAQKTVALSTGTMSVSTQSAAGDVTWASNNTDVITVEEKATGATLKLLKAGTATITATGANGSDSVTIKVTDSSGGGTGPVDPNPGGTTTTVEVELKVGDTSQVYEGAAGATITTAGNDNIATAKLEPFRQDGGTTRTLGSLITPTSTRNDITSYEGVITNNGHYMVLSMVNGKATISDTTDINEATLFTIKRNGNSASGAHSNHYGYAISTVVSGTTYYVARSSNVLIAQANAFTWYPGGDPDFSVAETTGSGRNQKTTYYILAYDNGWTIDSNGGWNKAGKAYRVKETTVEGKDVTNITFTGVKPGNTTYVIGGVTYHITVEAKTVNVTLEVGDSTTFNVGSSKISKFPDSNIAKAAWNDGVLTLAGMTVGNTECIVGDTKYVITVVAKGSTTGDSPLYVDLWVTNHGVLPDTSANYTVVNGGESTDTGARRVTLQYEANKFASSKGLSVSEFLPSTGSDTADSTRVAAYWKTRYLPQSTRQTTAGWTNKSGYGTDVLSGKAGGLDIERVRYYGGTWAYLPVGGTDWVDFTTAERDGTYKAAVTKNESGAQIAAFYMLKTEVTKEVTTYVTDWSDEVSDNQYKWIYGVALDYCVKFEGDTSTRYPATFGKTATTQSQWFNCQYATSETTAKDNGYTLFATEVSGSSWKGSGSSQYYRVINNIQAVETAQYEVYMITTLATAGDLSTVTDVDRQNYDMPDSIDYPDEYSKEKVIWAIDEKTATDSGLEKHDEYKQGGTPDVSRVVIQRGTGMLLTYYVRAKATTASKVTVEYYENRSNVKFYSFDIPTGTEKPNTFEQFLWNEALLSQTPYVNPWINEHYICNSDGRSITINSDLALVSGLAAKYKAGGFTLTNIVKSEDSRTLKLYYDFTNSFTYVVDFGVPAKIERKSDETVLKVTCGDKVLYDAEDPTAKDVVEGKNGKLYMTDVSSIYYELTTMQYSGTPDTFTLMFTYQNDDGSTQSEKAFNVTVIPASNVYYEDTKSFMTFENGQGVAENAKWTEEFDADKNAAIDSKQIAEIVGEANNNVYGYDPTYDNCTMFSLGRAHKVTVSADMVNNWNENSDAWPTAQFTFKGTGFDVISLTNDKSGLLTYKIEKQDGNGNWTTEKQQFVINYYDYGYDAEKGWTKDTRDTLYQLPVIKADGLAYGTYRVTLTVAYGAIFDKTGENKYSIWLDGVRIYDPAGPDLNQTYAKDGEGWAQYIELRDKLAEQKDQRTALFIEDNSNSASIEDYKNYGPNHEVYLLNKQAIAFQLGNIDKVAKVQIGAKAPMGSATLTVNGMEVKPLETATEMYYDITAAAKSGTVIITNGSTENSSILSLTQLKITYKENPSTSSGAELSILTAKQQQEVVQMVRAMYAPAPEPDPEPFAPERFEASWNRSTVKVGQKATLTVKTSEDVEAITVDGVTIDTYRTRTQRTGWGWNAKRVTYREFTYTITAKEAGTLNCSIAAFNAENVASEPITAALTVQAAAQRPSWGGWLGNFFGRWF